MQYNSKPWLFAVVGMVLGSFATYFPLQPFHKISPGEDQASALAAKASEDRASSSYLTFHTKGAEPRPPAQGMRAATAHQMFINFQGNNPASPRGYVRTVDDQDVDQAAMGMYLDKSDLLQLLENTAANQSKTLTGYYMIYAQESIRQHRVLFMGVYRDSNGDDRLMLPVDGSDQTAIFDWIMPCPNSCPEEAAGNSLWTLQNWMQ